MSESDVDFDRLFKGVSRGVPCEHAGHDRSELGCLPRYTEATWVLKQIAHVEDSTFVCLGFAAYFRNLMATTIICPHCRQSTLLSDLFRLVPMNLPSIINER